MKKRIQKYLAGEREGFSLVELIIVIAIMAILIGVIALAVIPNIQRSRESKDLSTLDNVMSSLNVAIANTQKKADVDTWSGADKKLADLLTASDSLATQFKQTFGNSEPSLGSSVVGSNTIHFKIDNTASPAKIKVYVGDGTIKCKYTTDENGAEKVMLVSSDGSSNS